MTSLHAVTVECFGREGGLVKEEFLNVFKVTFSRTIFPPKKTHF